MKYSDYYENKSGQRSSEVEQDGGQKKQKGREREKGEMQTEREREREKEAKRFLE